MHNDPVAHQSSLTARLFTTCATMVAHATGKPLAFAICLATVLLWAISGPIFAFSDTWQLVINTGTTIITFLMVFLIQNTQNRDARAMHLKLDELLRAMEGARTGLVDLEDLSDHDLRQLELEFRKLRERQAQALPPGERSSRQA
jgi:low affinity Fe/Cu permease